MGRGSGRKRLCFRAGMRGSSIFVGKWNSFALTEVEESCFLYLYFSKFFSSIKMNANNT